MKNISSFEEFAFKDNIIIILWDGIQGKITEQIFVDDNAVLTEYNGFTFYPNAIGTGPLTSSILPVLYSGKFKAYYAPNYKVIRNNLTELYRPQEKNAP